MEKEKPKCAICGSKDLIEFNNRHLCYVCKEHEQYRNVINVEIVQLKLGIIKKLPERYYKCTVSGEKLTDSEVKSLNENHAQITKEQYREVATVWQTWFSKCWFDFKKENNIDFTPTDEKFTGEISKQVHDYYTANYLKYN